ncbi:MAG TPA: hypothetical protein VJJ83_01575 [Candidatus Babeliales bacterium]|nr:hypothetical protein [Candidatus Babeliales bacterium]
MQALLKILVIAYLVGVVLQTKPAPDQSAVTHTRLAFRLKQEQRQRRRLATPSMQLSVPNYAAR